MLINSELPLTQLYKNVELNQYDFVLFHLYEKFPQYKEYYLQLRETHPDRIMIFDNSAYEYFVQGKELDFGAFRDAIFELKPDYYILPDVLMDQKATLQGVKSFLDEHRWMLPQSQPLAVMQGNRPQELFDCALRYWDMGIQAIGIPFHNSFYVDYSQEAPHITDQWRAVFGQLNKDMRYAIGRIQFVHDIQYMLNRFTHVHLLGSHNPYEKIFYRNIDTMDTGYPVKCAIMGYELFKEPEKPDIIIDNFMTTNLTSHQKALIDFNVNKFKEL